MEDPYIWTENLNDERVLKLVEEENKRFREFIGDLPEKLIDEVRKYYYLPNIWEAQITKRGTFVKINEAGRQLIKLFETGEIIVDSKKLEEELCDEVLLQSFTVDKEGRRLAYNFSIGGADEGITRIIDLKTGEIIEEIKPSLWNIVFLDDGYYFARFYRKEKTPDGMESPAERIFLKKEKEEIMVFGKGLGSGYFMNLRKSTDGKWAMLTVTFGWNKADIYLGPIDEPEKWEKVYSSDAPAYPIDVINGKLYIYTREGKGLGKIIAIENNKAEEIIPEDEFPLEWAVIVNNKILAGYLVHASSKLKVFTLDGRLREEISFEIPGQVYPLDSDGKQILLRYESFTVPYRLYRFREKLELVDEVKVEGEFEVSEDFAVSKDGTRIHYFVVKKKGAEDKKAWVFGYGGFNIALLPRFIPQVIPFIERGGTFVMANLRGGSEYGEEWHRAGMRENKQNVFDDFIAVLEKLKSEGYKVVAWGRSNGGLLVSAVLTQRPDVMDAALIGYPVIDMLRFHKLYIGSVWIPEYGNPDDPKDREFLLKYSPYHNVKPQKYPPTLIYTGLHDDRVHPAHALKFLMRLKEVNAPVYLRVETKSGHMGASPETRVKELTDLLAFVVKVLDVES
ncbi:S9 family peptidase [Thermococcus sp. M39]|uniref:prolyl oligopeptidase family serine peptidase n=1 Tax=unclassified Thermococcus TaxID=2627626 RepID=UPI00143C9D91|nr:MULTISPECIES: prolyl oligopeptidase family serine peptidase [unclassified Thermococcus]NJE09130.1 S9 family peptidase [Thermococcus sp. M39]NJE12079.1 S9 family peptidase [Thermococcus sp. LS2]